MDWVHDVAAKAQGEEKKHLRITVCLFFDPPSTIRNITFDNWNGTPSSTCPSTQHNQRGEGVHDSHTKNFPRDIAQLERNCI